MLQRLQYVHKKDRVADLEMKFLKRKTLFKDICTEIMMRNEVLTTPMTVENALTLKI